MRTGVRPVVYQGCLVLSQVHLVYPIYLVAPQALFVASQI